MAINKVDLTVSQIINDLNTGLTWFKKDDLGYGSIETKYGANAPQIMAIRKHPSLKDAETTITIFNIIDDTKNENSSSAESSATGTSSNMEQPKLDLVCEPTKVGSEASDIFANL
jgi:hypothetical protein